MTIKFPEDRDTENQRLTKYLFEEWREHMSSGFPAEEEYEFVKTAAPYIFDDGWLCVSGNAVFDLNLKARWLAASFICTKEKKAIVVTYNELIDSMRRNENMFIFQDVPFLVILFPELVLNADWAAAKLMDIILNRKRLAIYTTNSTLMQGAVGDIVYNLINTKSHKLILGG